MPGREKETSSQATASSSPIPGLLRRITSSLFATRASQQPQPQGVDAATLDEDPPTPPVATPNLPRRDFPFASGSEHLIQFFSTAATQCEGKFNLAHGEVVIYEGGPFAGLHAVVVGERGDQIWVVDVISAADSFLINPETPLAYPLKGTSGSDIFAANAIRSLQRRVAVAPALVVFVPDDDLGYVERQFTPGGQLRAAAALVGVKHMTTTQAQFLMNAPDLILEVGLDCRSLRLIPSYLPGKDPLGWIGCDDLVGTQRITVVASAVISKAAKP